jgi:hypothetical protein
MSSAAARMRLYRERPREGRDCPSSGWDDLIIDREAIGTPK